MSKVILDNRRERAQGEGMTKKRVWGTSLTKPQRDELTRAMDMTTREEVASQIGINVHTLRTAALGAAVQNGTAALITAWLDKQGSK